MTLALNHALTIYPTIDTDAVEAYGLETAPLVNYVSHSQKIASEYVLRVNGRKYRVYSWLTDTGSDAMYILKGGNYTFLSNDIENMLTYGNAVYGPMVPVAQAVRLAA